MGAGPTDEDERAALRQDLLAERLMAVQIVAEHGSSPRVQLRTPALQPTRTGIEFAVLFGGFRAWVLDELGHDGESEADWRDQLGFQYGVIIGGLAVAGTSQAIGAMPLRKDEPTCAINGDRKIKPQ